MGVAMLLLVMRRMVRACHAVSGISCSMFTFVLTASLGNACAVGVCVGWLYANYKLRMRLQALMTWISVRLWNKNSSECFFKLTVFLTSGLRNPLYHSIQCFYIDIQHNCVDICSTQNFYEQRRHTCSSVFFSKFLQNWLVITINFTSIWTWLYFPTLPPCSVIERGLINQILMSLLVSNLSCWQAKTRPEEESDSCTCKHYIIIQQYVAKNRKLLFVIFPQEDV